MSVIDIKELRKQANLVTSNEEWRKFAQAQNDLIESYQKQLETFKQKNHQLENILMNKHPLLTELVPEEQICIEQIERLRAVSVERTLTLEEVKRLDLLVKNLKLIREESTIILDNRKPESLQEADLVAIATRTDTES